MQVAGLTTSITFARRAFAAALPAVPLKRLRLLLAGEEFDTWETDDLVLKLPRSQAHAAKIDRELAIQELMIERLGSLVPPIVAVGEPTDVFPFRCIVFERAPGRQGQTNDGPIVRPKPWARGTLARDIGAALSTLHGTPLRDPRSIGIVGSGSDFEPIVDASEDAIAWASRVAGHAVDAFLVDPIPVDARPTGSAVLCHTDLKGEHLFVSEDGGRLTAIVDWADASITDPAVDFAGLAIWLGPSFVREVLGVYTGPADEGTFHRALFLARAGLLGYLGAMLEGATTASIPLLDAQLRAAFSEDVPAKR